MISHFRKLIKCQRGESDFPWFAVLIGIPILINVFGGDDDENDNKAVDTSKKEKAVLEEKARKTKTNDMIDTAKKEFEKAKKIAQEKIADAKDEYENARKTAVEKIDTAKKYKEEKKQVKEDSFSDTFSDTNDKFSSDEELFK